MLVCHTDEVTCVPGRAVGKVVVSRSSDEIVRVWKRRDGVWKSTVPEDRRYWITYVSVSGDVSLILSGTAEAVRIWNMRDGE